MVADSAKPVDGPARVLVTYASRMGSTAEIGEAIGEQLRAAGLDVTVVPVGQAPEPGGFDAVVCGSAIYATRWEKAARHYIRQHRQALAERPTWLFESGPSGDSAEQRHQTSPSVLRLAEDIGSFPPQVFGGNLDPARAKTRIARWVANSDLAGDYRNWDQIRAWADGSGRQVAERAAGQGAAPWDSGPRSRTASGPRTPGADHGRHVAYVLLGTRRLRLALAVLTSAFEVKDKTCSS